MRRCLAGYRLVGENFYGFRCRDMNDMHRFNSATFDNLGVFRLGQNVFNNRNDFLNGDNLRYLRTRQIVIVRFIASQTSEFRRIVDVVEILRVNKHGNSQFDCLANNLLELIMVQSSECIHPRDEICFETENFRREFDYVVRKILLERLSRNSAV